jgi:hypothetical protein
MIDATRSQTAHLARSGTIREFVGWDVVVTTCAKANLHRSVGRARILTVLLAQFLVVPVRGLAIKTVALNLTALPAQALVPDAEIPRQLVIVDNACRVRAPIPHN